MPELMIDFNNPNLSNQQIDQLKRLIDQKREKETIIASLSDVLGKMSNDYMIFGMTYNTLKGVESDNVQEISLLYGNVGITYSKKGIPDALLRIEKTRKTVENSIKAQKQSIDIEKKNLNEIDNKIIGITNKVNMFGRKLPEIKTNMEKREEIDNTTEKELEPVMNELEKELEKELG